MLADADLRPSGYLSWRASYTPCMNADARDGPYVTLPDVEALRRYLIRKGVERALAAARAGTMAFPLAITKRGAIVYGRK
jgi:hypothetical protein